MRSLEKGRNYESLDESVARIAYAYGFTASPVAIPKKYTRSNDDTERDASLSIALLKNAGAIDTPTPVWGFAKGSKRSTHFSFAMLSSKHPVAHAVVVKTVLAVAERAGFTDLSVLVSSVGDNESKKRFTRELATFFKKNAEDIPSSLRQTAAHEPDRAYQTLLATNDPLLLRAPRRIDYLSENSRKAMLETISLFESVGIAYQLESGLPSVKDAHAELLFAVEGVDPKGNRVRIASGGRFDEYLKAHGKENDSAVSMSVTLPMKVNVEDVEDEPTCFVVHVGDAAKLKTFAVVEELWKANLLVGQVVLAENLRQQMEKAREASAKNVAIIGQREALDGTIIVRSLKTQMQTTIPLDALVKELGKKR